MKIVQAVKDKQFNRLYLNSFTVDGRTYWLMEGESRLRLAYLPKDRKRLMSDTLLIDDRELFYVQSGIEELLQQLRSKETYGEQDGELILFHEGQKPIRLTGFRNPESRLIMQPCIIEDREGRPIEGATFVINDPSNVATLNFREVEALSYHFSKVDLFLYSQLLLNHFASMIGQLDRLEQQVPAFKETLWSRQEEEIFDREGEMSSTPTISKMEKRNQVFGLGTPSSTL